MTKKLCTRCGQPAPAHHLCQGLCDGCKWDTWIPAGYEKAEKYVPHEVWDHPNATCRPALGVEFLDGRPAPLGARLAAGGRKPRPYGLSMR